jgi:hypothetical protein
MECYEAQHGGLTVSIGDDGTCLGVRLTSNAMTLSDQVLASRIVRLHTLAYLRRLSAIGQECSGAVAGLEFVPSAQQVAAYARTLEF